MLRKLTKKETKTSITSSNKHQNQQIQQGKGSGLISTVATLYYLKCLVLYKNLWCAKSQERDFLGGAVVKNPPANAGDMGLSPGPGRSHMPQSN